MPDYLSQLALRIQQPEFAIQPRPVSRFESQRHANSMASEPYGPEEADELKLQSAVFSPADTNAGRLTQPADSGIRNGAGAVDLLSEVQPTRESRLSYPGESKGAPAIVTTARNPETTKSPVVELAHPAPRSQQVEQSERIIRSAVPPAIVTSVRSPETTESSVVKVAQPAPRSQQAEQHERIARIAVDQAQPSERIDGLEQPINKASPDPLGRRERSELTDLVARRENELRHPIVRVENARREGASHPSTRAPNHREIGMFSEPMEAEPLFGRKAEIATKSGVPPVPGPRGEPADPRLRMAHATDVPTIQVTIGRVEIRATVASTQARKTPTHRPAMSLDEYLKQRNGSRA